MKNLPALLPVIAAALAIFGYLTWLVRRLAKALEWVGRLPREHEFLMETVSHHTEQISEILTLLTEGKFPRPPKRPSAPKPASSARRSSPSGSRDSRT